MGILQEEEKKRDLDRYVFHFLPSVSCAVLFEVNETNEKLVWK